VIQFVPRYEEQNFTVVGREGFKRSPKIF